MLTKGQVLLQKYSELHQYACKHFSDELFPPVGELDAVTIIVIMDQFFSPYYETQDYTTPIKMGLRLKGISLSEKEFDTHYSNIKDIIHSLLHVIRELK